jgi:hypothetical protein
LDRYHEGMARSGDARPASRPASGAKSGSRHVDVTRLELENLYSELEALSRGLRRVESDLRRLAEKVSRLDRRSDPHT